MVPGYKGPKTLVIVVRKVSIKPQIAGVGFPSQSEVHGVN
jgi:hypothetical protein